MCEKRIGVLPPLVMGAGKRVGNSTSDAFEQIQALPIQSHRLFSSPHAVIVGELRIASGRIYASSVMHLDDRGADRRLGFCEIDSGVIRQGCQQGNFVGSPHRLFRKPVQKRGGRHITVEDSSGGQVFTMVSGHIKEVVELILHRLSLQNCKDYLFGLLNVPVPVRDSNCIHDCRDGADGLNPRCPAGGVQGLPVVCDKPRIDRLNEANHAHGRKQRNSYLLHAFHVMPCTYQKDILAC